MPEDSLLLLPPFTSIPGQLAAGRLIIVTLLPSLSLLALAFPSLRRLLLRALAQGTGGGDRRIKSRCTVCLDDVFHNEEEFRVLPECGHGFHTQCVDRWLRCHRSCPLCRHPVTGDRRSFQERILASMLLSFCRWMDSRYNSELTLLFCQNM